MPARTGFNNGVAGFQNVETVVRIVRHQHFQRLHDIPCSDQFRRQRQMSRRRDGLTSTPSLSTSKLRQRASRKERIRRFVEPIRRLAGNSHARFRVLFFNQRPRTRE